MEMPMSASLSLMFLPETFSGLPLVATSPRSCASSYSSASRRFAPASISSASACARCAARWLGWFLVHSE